jgi:hypothetical protein
MLCRHSIRHTVVDDHRRLDHRRMEANSRISQRGSKGLRNAMAPQNGTGIECLEDVWFGLCCVVTPIGYFNAVT